MDVIEYGGVEDETKFNFSTQDKHFLLQIQKGKELEENTRIAHNHKHCPKHQKKTTVSSITEPVVHITWHIQHPTYRVDSLKPPNFYPKP